MATDQFALLMKRIDWYYSAFQALRQLYILKYIELLLRMASSGAGYARLSALPELTFTNAEVVQIAEFAVRENAKDCQEDHGSSQG